MTEVEALMAVARRIEWLNSDVIWYGSMICIMLLSIHIAGMMKK